MTVLPQTQSSYAPINVISAYVDKQWEDLGMLYSLFNTYTGLSIKFFFISTGFKKFPVCETINIMELRIQAKANSVHL